MIRYSPIKSNPNFFPLRLSLFIFQSSFQVLAFPSRAGLPRISQKDLPESRRRGWKMPFWIFQISQIRPQRYTPCPCAPKYNRSFHLPVNILTMRNKGSKDTHAHNQKYTHIRMIFSYLPVSRNDSPGPPFSDLSHSLPRTIQGSTEEGERETVREKGGKNVTLETYEQENML